MIKKASLLVIDDIPENIQLLDDYLCDAYEVQYALSGPDGLALAGRIPMDLILLDVMMPGMDGYQVCAALKGDAGTRSIPVIFITSRNDPYSESQALAAGAVDFIHKPVNRDVLRARVRLHLDLRAREREIQRIHALDLEEKQRRLEFALRAADAAMWFWNPMTGWTEWSEGIWRLYGLEAGSCEPSIDAWASSVHPEDRARVAAQGFQAAEAGQKFSLEWRVAGLPPGQERWLMSHGQPVFDGEGRVESYLGIVLDITERKRAESLLLGQNQILGMIASGAPLKDVLDQLVRVLEAQEPGMIGSVLLLDADGIHLRHAASPSLPPAYCQALDSLEAGPNAGSCGTAVHRGAPVMVEDIPSNPLWADFRDLAAAHGLRACWSIPVTHASGEMLGAVALYSRSPRAPETRHRHLLDAAARMVAIAIGHSRREQALRESRARQEELSRRLVDIQEEERRRLAHELHDEIGQVLTAVNINLQSAQLQAAPGKLRDSLRACADLVGRAIQQVRGRSLELRPSMLDDLGLIPAMEHHIERQAELGACAIELRAEPLTERPPGRVEIACYRVMQEALTNALRHAQASRVRVGLSCGDGRLWLQVRDDGRGFDADAARKRARSGASFGLLGMEERAILSGGDIEIMSEPGGGCEIRAWFPLGAEQE